MGLSRVTLALTLIIVLVGSAFAQGPVVAPSQAPTTLSTPVASPVEAADAPIAETPTLAAMPPTDLKKIGAKNIEAGIGCGVGFGHGFGAGLALKPGVVQRIQFSMIELVSKMMMKFGVAPDLSIGQGLLPASVQSSMTAIQGSARDPMESIAQFGKKIPGVNNQDPAGDGKVNLGIERFGSEDVPSKLPLKNRTEKLINGFLKDPLLSGENSELHDRVVKHQQVIEELMEENERLRQVLVEDLKVPSSKLQVRHSVRNESPCSDCFKCSLPFLCVHVPETVDL
uniref:Uncharacterized protein n=1 Tax=Chenopodium quinoa TaxID=63459 RepID=A0A803L5L1_CHEQI